jgi:hypothetical protein
MRDRSGASRRGSVAMVMVLSDIFCRSWCGCGEEVWWFVIVERELLRRERKGK